ncbi:hypothetical protein [Marinagarivorans algicola]|uniref:hypothetical protein n=1 Tax=Marinagarivorans algicola TaxID=1513270 RepID=UPI0006B9D427|nr:hypothetical protein [Marinagarivorans algicola]
MKNIICLMSVIVSFSAFADTQAERDEKLIRDLELQGELTVEPAKTKKFTINHSSANRIDAVVTDEVVTDEVTEKSATDKFTPTRIVKVVLEKQQSAESIANELGLELVSGHDGQVAAFKVSENQNILDAVATLKAHAGVIAVKREQVMRLNRPQ